ncbi:hypothetical protein M3905_000887 [Vibrio metschnikovii]|nr:hypothetical protein [Vibrio metschnikovii]
MSTIVFRNSQEAFIHKNVFQILQAEGHEPLNASRAADLAVETYRTTAAFGGRGGKCFDYCLGRARLLLLPAKKKAEKAKRARGKAA